MVWYGEPWVLCALYIPAALAGALLPYALLPRFTAQPSSTVAGSCLLNSILASIVTLAGAQSGFLFAFWAWAGLIAAVVCSLASFQVRISRSIAFDAFSLEGFADQLVSS